MGDKKSDREGGRESKGERGREIDPTEEKDMDGERGRKWGDRERKGWRR